MRVSETLDVFAWIRKMNCGQCRPDNNTQHMKKFQQPQSYPTFESEREDLKNRLNRALRRLRSIDPAERTMGPKTRSYQVTRDMAYILDDIQRGPVFTAPMSIRSGQALISGLESTIARLSADKDKKIA